jgi:hypothetical protein
VGFTLTLSPKWGCDIIGNEKYFVNINKGDGTTKVKIVGGFFHAITKVNNT